MTARAVSIGLPDGPRITFEVGHHQGPVGLRPLTTVSIPTIVPPQGPPPVASQRPPRRSDHRPRRRASDRPPASRSGSRRRSRRSALTRGAPPPCRSSAPAPRRRPYRRWAAAPGRPAGTRPSCRLCPRAAEPRIGRELDNEIVIHDVLASRHHAVMVPTPNGTEIRDAQQHQRDVRQRKPRRIRGACRGRRGHDRQRRPGVRRRHPGAPPRGGHPQRRPRGARRRLRHQREEPARRRSPDAPVPAR